MLKLNMLKREDRIAKKDRNMEYLFIGSVHLDIKVREPEIIDIETGELIQLNGHNGSSCFDGLSIKGEVSINEEKGKESVVHSYLDSES